MFVTESFLAVGANFVSTVETIATEDWSKPAIGEWTVRDLVGHTLRAVTLVRTYRSEETAAPALNASEYFIAALRSLGDPAAVAQRGRDAGVALGDDPLAHVRSEYAATVGAIGEIHYVKTPVGPMARDEYLRSRIVELAVHTHDLQRATNQETVVDSGATNIALGVLTEVAVAHGTGPTLLAALTGRTSLPLGFSIW
jgi:uncharacterized protein (TIGR03083 family)